MKLILLSLSLFASINCMSQVDSIVKYFDSDWNPTTKELAKFYTKFIKADSVYNCYSYYVTSQKLQAKSVFKDTLFQKPVGLIIRYYENGRIEDSTVFDLNGKRQSIVHYYESGKLWFRCNYDKQSDKQVCEGFDENGNQIKDFIELSQAEFPGGVNAWTSYLVYAQRNFDPTRNGAPIGVYRVIVKFSVDVNGKVSDVEAETNFGYGMEKKAVEIIRKSQTWIAARYLGKPVKTFRRQPITFVVEPQ